MILSSEPDPGDYGVAAKTLQKVRGMCVHWLTCNAYWYCLGQPIDMHLSHVSEAGHVISCGEIEVRMSFFNEITLTGALAPEDEDWGLLFLCSLGRAQAMRRR